ncbi:MAG: M23 family metallopeptidase [Flavobacteriales bacterium]|nr:M23 family metallopeptidase [Flavobacteriales bacterium]
MRHKSRLVILNDDTFEEEFSLILSPLNVFTWGGVTLMLFAAFLILVIAFTPLREFIPGYADVNTRKLATYAAFRADSLQRSIEQTQAYLDNLKFVLSGGVSQVSDSSTAGPNLKVDIKNISDSRSKEDSILRKVVEQEERYNLSSLEKNSLNDPMYKFLLFTPLRGIISSEFDESQRHFGVDVVPESSEASVKATYEGVVIQSSWTSEEGNVMYIQHQGNLISVYKHNSVLLKKIGDKVEAGEAIAIVGNSGELSSGPHLHFELWYKGNPVNPKDYMVF